MSALPGLPHGLLEMCADSPYSLSRAHDGWVTNRHWIARCSDPDAVAELSQLHLEAARSFLSALLDAPRTPLVPGTIDVSVGGTLICAFAHVDGVTAIQAKYAPLLAGLEVVRLDTEANIANAKRREEFGAAAHKSVAGLRDGLVVVVINPVMENGEFSAHWAGGSR